MEFVHTYTFDQRYERVAGFGVNVTAFELVISFELKC